MKRLGILFFMFFSFVVFGQTRIEVQPVNIKQSTGLYFKKGEKIVLTAEGRWSLWDRYTQMATADGHPFRANDFGNWGILLGQVGSGEVFIVGSKRELESNAEGILYLFPNKGHFLIEYPLPVVSLYQRIFRS